MSNIYWLILTSTPGKHAAGRDSVCRRAGFPKGIRISARTTFHFEHRYHILQPTTLRRQGLDLPYRQKRPILSALTGSWAQPSSPTHSGPVFRDTLKKRCPLMWGRWDKAPENERLPMSAANSPLLSWVLQGLQCWPFGLLIEALRPHSATVACCLGVLRGLLMLFRPTP